MTLYEIEVLMHYHCSPSVFPRWQAPGYLPVIRTLKQDNLLRLSSGENSAAPTVIYTTTERGIAFLSAIQSLPLPVASWEIPGFRRMLEDKR